MATEQRTTTGGGDDEQPLGLTVASGAVAAAVIVPLLWLVESALEVGLSDALALLTRPTTVQVFLNSTVLVVLVTAACIALGVPLAYLTVRTDLPFKRFWTVAVSLPLVIPSYIGAFTFVSAFGPRGVLQRLLAPLGIDSLPEIYGLPGAVLVLTLYTYPYVFITTRAALKSMDTTLIDAARTLNHSRWEAFKRVTIPQIRPAVAAGALLAALYALSDFGTPAIMRFDAFTRVIYVEFGAFGRDTATLLSLQLVAVTLVILTLESQIRGNERTTTGGRSGSVMKLGRWKYPAVGFAALVAIVALVVPMGILLTWLAEGVAETGRSLAFRPEYAFNSVLVSAATAGAATIAGLPVAYLAARHSSRLSSLFERATYIGYAVPGVVLGLALVFFGSSYATPIYQTLYLLVFAYVIRFLPQAIGSLRASFLRVDPTLPEAARTLGETPTGAFRHVTLPLVAPGLFGGAALVFLTTMKELPATLMLRPSGFKTLVTHIWSAHEQGYFGQAVVPALILLFVSGLSMLIIIRQEGYDVK
ncbi:iron ABC transporter permease [Haloferax mediterranei ATCC 33500]|uniref:ABC-type iron(III) transport system, permease protein n=1 Tax=Haloferax mediterranei (strain ATCC 33500 / DSM 1411 / JCM 8866 / NBRC 14739 / NCIMB 2177 / R-4) TaxID=523841 RepID=I3R5J0_HALMT|nr:iron ABC transporter permease [Haloferax mediterranei]AFK19500.1 ABC-type iron(III) transport system, permease protein [Haloferax mediterranei ATCC 33500]AHZ21158.1 iron ABC transporter permease [Haloferax mediterranei ATCC 33500]EMA04312.1 ABC-type iron(III) transport system, permease protein [Haloferax mediterranei ATCC 33500]MDX5989603.1 iron ABC transporter permease [Haloferax mediterranei ATCC 33500]QCQ75959.1 iron ABC transporter permease [Haloferax mediterranei ATCC 33500]